MKCKRFLSVFLALVLAFSCLSVGLSAYAAEEEPRYFQRGILTDGTNTAYWVIDKDNKILYISGDGVTNARTPDYPSAQDGPFAGRTDVTRVVIEEDVAYVGAYVLANMTSVDTIEIQSNLLKNENSINTNAFAGDTGIRNVQGDSEALSTNTLINAVKVGVGIYTGDWLGVVKNIISTGSDIAGNDGTLDDESVDALVNDYITNGEKIFIGNLDDVIDAYEVRMANPCYTNNAFHHDYQVDYTEAPTCTEDGYNHYTCSVCHDEYTDTVDALGHTYVEEVYIEPTCTARGVMDCYCTVCGESDFSPIPALGHTRASIPYVAPTCTSVGYTEGYYCTVCGETILPQNEIPKKAHRNAYEYFAETDSYRAECQDCHAVQTEFVNDTSALVEAEAWYSELAAEDYTAESYGALYDVAELHRGLSADDTLAYPQYAIDDEVYDILTLISELQAYYTVSLETEHAAVTLSYENTEEGAGEHPVVFGTDITVTAVPDAGYTFIAWYDVNNKRYLTTDAVYSCKVTSNLNLRAVIKDSTYSTLTFRGEGGQTIAAYSFDPDDWAEMDDFEHLIPPVPYKYGFTNGRWIYNDRAVTELSLGRNYEITAEYDAVEVPVPDLPQMNTEGTPSLTLTYYYNEEDGRSVGTLVMASRLVRGTEIESVGIAYIKQPAQSFDPTSVNLTLNSHVTPVNFEGVSDSGLYILNIRNLNTKSNWAIKGYMTYYDDEGVLRIAYTNQISLVNRQAV